jgi:lysophospholipase L1-like esterase
MRRIATANPAPVAIAAMAGATFALGAWRWLRLMASMRAGDELANRAVAFARNGKPHAPRVLVVGDSTGVGTGAARPEDSIAGRLGAAHPEVTIVNRARNGAKTFDAILQVIEEGEARYDLVLVHIGGNDVLRGTPVRVLAPQVEALLGRVRRLSANVVVTTLPNLGLLPMFFPPLSWWFSRQSRVVCGLFAAAAKRHGAHYVDFFHPHATEHFCRRSGFFACDGLHPSSALYAYIYETMIAATPIATLLTRPQLAAVPARCAPEPHAA